MSLFKGGIESPQAHASDFIRLASVALLAAEGDIGRGGDLLDKGDDEDAIRVLSRAVEIVASLRAVLASGGIHDPRVFALLDELEGEARVFRKAARARLTDGVDEEE